MAIAAVIVKIMPDSPQANLKTIEESAKKLLTENGAKNISFTEEPIAFGLIAIKAKFAWPEEKPTDLIENVLSEIEAVNSVTIDDYRRAFG